MHIGNDGNDNSTYPSGIRKRPIGKISILLIKKNI
jgi:hypothetical protein